MLSVAQRLLASVRAALEAFTGCLHNTVSSGQLLRLLKENLVGFNFFFSIFVQSLRLLSYYTPLQQAVHKCTTSGLLQRSSAKIQTFIVSQNFLIIPFLIKMQECCCCIAVNSFVIVWRLVFLPDIENTADRSNMRILVPHGDGTMVKMVLWQTRGHGFNHSCLKIFGNGAVVVA